MYNGDIVSDDTQLSRLETVYESIRQVLDDARRATYQAVNSAMVRAYWDVGRIIVEEEQRGDARAKYGSRLIFALSARLTQEFGKGFTARNLWYMRSFYSAFPIVHALRAELTWTHYRLLLRVENEKARGFYLAEAAENRWSTRELERQINSLLYERLAMSKDKDRALDLSTRGLVVAEPKDVIKDPYVLEFLGLRESPSYLESDLEQALIDKLHDFMLELGKGFSFVARQRRITIEGDHLYIDLVFYNYILKCFVLIDLKVGKLDHGDIGQMDFYVRYFEREVKLPDDNPTIGLILCAEKNEAMVRYTLLDESRSVFASKYKLYLPTEDELKEEIEREMSRARSALQPEAISE
jgi:predicted nuclease of restriction endonuclease-like (RecB) superfamily